MTTPPRPGSAALAALKAKSKAPPLPEAVKLARRQALQLLSSVCAQAPVSSCAPATWVALVEAARAAAFESLGVFEQAPSLRLDFSKNAMPAIAALGERALKEDPRREPLWGPLLAQAALNAASSCSPEEALVCAHAMPLPLFSRMAALCPLSDAQRKAAAVGLAQKNAPELSAHLLGSPEGVLARLDPHQTQSYLGLAAESAAGFKEIRRRVEALRPNADPERIAQAFGERLACLQGAPGQPSPIGQALLAADASLLPPLKRAPLSELALIASLFLNERDLPGYWERLDALALSTGESASLKAEDLRALRLASSGNRLATHVAPAAARSGKVIEIMETLARASALGPKRVPSLFEALLPGLQAAFELDPASLSREMPDRPDHATRLGANLPELLARALMHAKLEPGAPGAEPARRAFELCLLSGYSPSRPPAGRSHSLGSKLLASKNALGKAWASELEAQEISVSLRSAPDSDAAIKPSRRGLSL